ncbi:YdjY domain-containing protein [Rosistilla oblonga]|uniref:Uncharacterized protein n=1 Tax=Rosistilla oblonga TaxID=2527990 RepID=A0A518ITL9_9BACT|nr:YdjY domain-containing protein [Rosistilla oblonga]QDV56435.1 hypothetical protein Mal33_24250 [Rosistilla oblonga]
MLANLIQLRHGNQKSAVWVPRSLACLLLTLVSLGSATAQPADTSKPIADLPASEDPDRPQRPSTPEESESPTIKGVIAAFDAPKGATRLAPDARLWIDKPNRRVIVDGYVAVQEGLLEMFACPAGTKEHESAVAVLARSQYVHAALLAVGATPGRPVQFQPKFSPPTGDRIAIWVLWRDKEGKRHRAKAQEWICKTGTKEQLNTDFVFAGSQWWTDPRSGRDFYSADDGDLICVSNFASATLDVPIESSKDAEYLEFSACTENMPPRGTPIRMVMIPVSPALNAKPADKEKAGEAKPADKPAADAKLDADLDSLGPKDSPATQPTTPDAGSDS